jgi:beta-mannosidase
VETSSLTSANHRAFGEQILSLNGTHEYFSTSANFYNKPEEFDKKVEYFPAQIPGLVSQNAGCPADLSNLDNYDYWYKIHFSVDDFGYQKNLLKFEGLLTLCEVYFNHTKILSSENAFRVYEVDVTALLQENNTLFICFRALKPRYQAKHPRPNYMTRFVNERNLRFFRTPLIGYTPGFSDETKLVGPYRAISLVRQQILSINTCWINTSLINSNTGQISLALSLQFLSMPPKTVQMILLDEANQSEKLHFAQLVEADADHTFCLNLNAQTVLDIAPYWPHTHGEPKRYQLKLRLDENTKQEIVLGHVGFRKIECAFQPALSLRYNGKPIYLRGACWTPIDPQTLNSSRAALLNRLSLLQNAGVNMLRISGNMPYESDDFYEICDALGILIYQEFAFSNFDYPVDNAAFVEEVKHEAIGFLKRHGAKSCLTSLSGGSEVYQQACMMGLEIGEIDNRLFSEILADIAHQFAPHVPYFIGSPYAKNGLPFHSGEGPSNYHGVGGYRRSFEDARLFKGRFIIECLPFSNIPEDQTLRNLWHGKMPELHSAVWKDAIPRDPGSGWDFADITDFYLEKIFLVDPIKLRANDQARYLKFARATVAEAVETTLSIFRADAEHGRVALVWNCHDFKPGAGWGYIDILGNPKSAFYALARTAATTAILTIDEGLDGLSIYLCHEAQTAIDCQLKITLFTEEGQIFAEKTQPEHLSPNMIKRLSVDYFFGKFVDSSYAYRFGPRQFVACHAELMTHDGQIIAQKTYAHPEVTHATNFNLTLNAMATAISTDLFEVTITCNQPAFYVVLDVDDFLPSDNYFHLMPKMEKKIQLRATKENINPYGRIYALNSKHTMIIQKK